ncbi:MAG: cytochrome c [Hyphomonas sp.]
MTIRRTSLAIALIAGAALLGACNKAAAPEAEPTVLDNGLTAKEQIEARQGQLKKMGKAFKTMNDQMKSGAPDVAALQTAAASLKLESGGMEDWFPAGTGPDSGVKTDALPLIWEDRADFEEKLANFRAASDNLAEVALGGDVTAIGEAMGKTGMACKSCHDRYREDD